MSRWLVCGGLFIEAVSSLLTIPGLSEVGTVSAWLAGGFMAALPAAYRVLAGPFSIVLGQPIESLPTAEA